jgi:hypothetical protein
MFAKVKNGIIEEILGELPKSQILPTGETVCGFDLLSDSERIEKAGIYPIVNLTPEYAAATHELGEAVYTVKADCIELVYQIVPIAPIQIDSISMRQARLELLNRNLLDAVNAKISAMPLSAQIEWEYATEVRRDNPLVSYLASALNLSESDMNEFYRVASIL